MATYRVLGLEKITAALRAFPDALVKKSLDKALAKGGAMIQSAAKARAPVGETGLMQSDIISVKSKNPQNFGFQARRVILVKYRGKGGAPYWRFVEFGTQKMAPRPFMRPAFDTQKEAALATIIQSIASDIPSIAKQVGGS